MPTLCMIKLPISHFQLGLHTQPQQYGEKTGSRPFYGHSYTTPTPREHILQSVGLAITKGLGYHMHRARGRIGAHPNHDSDLTPAA